MKLPESRYPAVAFVALLFGLLTGLQAQNSGEDDSSESLPLTASWETRTEARALRLMIPAPRGQIVDTSGLPMVQNKVTYRLGIGFPLFDQAMDATVLSFAKSRLAAAESLVPGATWTPKDKEILNHYKHRRWLPLLVSGTLDEDQMDAIENGKERAEGLLLHAVYERYYPHGKFAPHVLGAIKNEISIPTGPIADLDPIFEITKGRDGLELAFDEDLTGTHGEINVLFDTDGTELSREIVERPIPGANVVSTLDVHYQRYAEESLAKNTHGGAMVVIDARGGDILAMASFPCYDPSMYVGGLSQELWDELRNDPKNPLYAKTFQGKYPPASTFKTVVALAGLEDGRISRHTMFPCPSSMSVGNRVFRNWNKKSEPSMNVVGALKRSCNTWFYTVGMDTGSDSILAMARNLGFGQTVGLPIAGENSGDLPNNEEHRKRVGFAIRGGDLANISIGQGSVTATPLQVARSMAAIGTGEYLSELRLIKQVQDVNNNIIKTFPPPHRTQLQVSRHNLDVVREGMVAVVSGSNGTGARAAIPQAQVAGKTGTAQWVISKKQNLAWFAGFVPAKNPRFAFAAVYEGNPGEKVGGGSKAAPIVHDVLKRMYNRLEADGGGEKYEELTENAPKVELKDLPVARPLDVIPAAPIPEALPPEPEKKRGLFQRLFRR